MKKWFQQQIGPIGIALAILIALFPQSLAKIELIIKFVAIHYWLQISLVIIIILLLLVFRLLLKQQQQNEPSK